MEHSLLCPIQARVNNVIIHNVPKSLTSSSNQSIIITDHKFNVPIEFHGPIPFIDVTYPNEHDMEMHDWISLIPRRGWVPYIENFNVYSLTSAEMEYTNYLYDTVINNYIFSSLQSKEENNAILTPERLFKVWNVPLHITNMIMDVTTSKSLQVIKGKVSQRFRTDIYQRRYRRLGEPFLRFYTGTIFSKVKSAICNIFEKLYSNRPGLTRLYPMEKEATTHETFTVFIHEVGIPHKLHSYNAKTQVLGEFRKKVNKYKVHTSAIKPAHLGRTMLSGR